MSWERTPCSKNTPYDRKSSLAHTCNRSGNDRGPQYALTDEISMLSNGKILRLEGVLRMTGVMHNDARRLGTWVASIQRLVPFDSGTGLVGLKILHLPL